MRFFIVLGLLAASAVSVQAKDFTPQNGVIDFDLPSGNLCCSYFEDVGYYPEGGSGPQLSCTRVQPKYWVVKMRPNGKIQVYKNPGEAPGCGYGTPLGNVLGYGETWSKGAFTCTSSRNGITCKAGRKGFKLSRKGLSKF